MPGTHEAGWRRHERRPGPRAAGKVAHIENSLSRFVWLRPDEAAFLATRYERALSVLRGKDKET